MPYHTTLQMRVLYSAPVTQCVRHLRILPTAQYGTQCVRHLQWRCTPEPDACHESNDDFGNRVLELRHARIARKLQFDLALTTEQCDALSTERDARVSRKEAGAFVLFSALCDGSEEIQRIARQIRANAQVSDAAKAIRACAWTHNALAYSLRATNARTTASQALRGGKGACQDYAHLMIALSRALSLPARYVSGFNPAEGLMHAWVEVLCDGCWQAFDPTHNRPATGELRGVFVACGRDFRDVAPVTGTYRGTARAKMTMQCKTTLDHE